MLPLIGAPNPILRQKARAVEIPPSSALLELAQGMFEAMAHYRGIGLAAPQVGQSLRLIVIDTASGPTAYLNPEVLKSSWRKTNFEEGCLSLPGVYGVVRRPARVLAAYVDLQGSSHEEWMEGLQARVFQHEVDHVNGILFTDHTKKITSGAELMATYGVR
jgi:peptide deformylase